MAFSDGFTWTKDVFVDTTVFQLDWFISIFLVLLTMFIITRETEKWKTLAFPVTVAWHAAGITPSFLWYFATAITFIVSSLSMQTIGSALNIITGTARKISGAEDRQKLREAEATIKQEYEDAITKARKKDFQIGISAGSEFGSQYLRREAKQKTIRAGTTKGITYLKEDIEGAKKAARKIKDLTKKLFKNKKSRKA